VKEAPQNIFILFNIEKRGNCSSHSSFSEGYLGDLKRMVLGSSPVPLEYHWISAEERGAECPASFT
jgi:hypothetical protein